MFSFFCLFVFVCGGSEGGYDVRLFISSRGVQAWHISVVPFVFVFVSVMAFGDKTPL